MRASEKRISLSGQLPKSCESLSRPAIGQTRPDPDHLSPWAFLSPTWNSCSPGWLSSPPTYSLPHLAISFVHLIFEPFSHRHWFSVGQTFAMPRVQNSQWNSSRQTRSFLRDSLPLPTNCKDTRPLYILPQTRSSRFLRANYVIAATEPETRSERNGKPLDGRVKVDIARF